MPNPEKPIPDPENSFSSGDQQTLNDLQEQQAAVGEIIAKPSDKPKLLEEFKRALALEISLAKEIILEQDETMKQVLHASLDDMKNSHFSLMGQFAVWASNAERSPGSKDENPEDA